MPDPNAALAGMPMRGTVPPAAILPRQVATGVAPVAPARVVPDDSIADYGSARGPVGPYDPGPVARGMYSQATAADAAGQGASAAGMRLGAGVASIGHSIAAPFVSAGNALVDAGDLWGRKQLTAAEHIHNFVGGLFGAAPANFFAPQQVAGAPSGSDFGTTPATGLFKYGAGGPSVAQAQAINAYQAAQPPLRPLPSAPAGPLPPASKVMEAGVGDDPRVVASYRPAEAAATNAKQTAASRVPSSFSDIANAAIAAGPKATVLDRIHQATAIKSMMFEQQQKETLHGLRLADYQESQKSADPSERAAGRQRFMNVLTPPSALTPGMSLGLTTPAYTE